MKDEASILSNGLADLLGAIESWEARGESTPLEHWLARELDGGGAPVSLPLGKWPAALERMARAREVRPGWPASLDERATDFARMLMRFSRPDGRPAVAPGDAKPRPFWKRIAREFPAPDVERVLSWWLPGYDAEPAPPPLPAWSSPDRVLGVLRADWTPRGDFLAFDQRQEAAGTHFELFGAGVPWLGPIWSAPALSGATATIQVAAPTAWATNSSADVAEWTFRAGGRSVSRLALMLRGRRLAILADQVNGVEPGSAWEWRTAVPDVLTVEPLADVGGLVLRKRPGGKVAQLIPVGGGRLKFDAERHGLSLVQSPARSTAWLAMVVSWDSARNRKPPLWKPLTVAENGKACPPDVAWAARVAWGLGESFVIYRSFGPPQRRSFLGFTTTARFLVGRFAVPEGDIDPIVTLT